MKHIAGPGPMNAHGRHTVCGEFASYKDVTMNPLDSECPKCRTECAEAIRALESQKARS